jgi:hypothetical protein
MRILGKHVLPRIGLCLLWATCAGPAAPAEECTQVFRGRPYDARFFRPTGSNTARVIRAESQGLRISLAADHGSKLPVGLVTRFGVRGDFDIAMAFDLLRVDRPPSGHGAGVSIWITMVSPTQEAATIARQVRTNGEQVWLSNRASTPVGEKRRYHGGTVATQATSGQLRLVRKGSILSFLIAQGESDDFRKVYESELGTADLDTVRFAADNGGSPTAVDVRIRLLRIRADDLPQVPKKVLAQPARWPIWLAVALAVLAFAAAGLWLWSSSARARRSRAR